MSKSYEYLRKYLVHIRDQYNVQICVKDYCGFIPINKELDEALLPFLAHTNPFCMYIKSDNERYRTCLTMIRRMRDRSQKNSTAFFGMCHAGLGEYVIPIFSDSLLLGSVNAGFFQFNEGKSLRRIQKACGAGSPLDPALAADLYRTYIHSATINPEDLLPPLEMMAEYLGQTYREMKNTHSSEDSALRFHSSSEDTILTHAIEYIRQNACRRITASELARFCHCSESYLSRIFKKRTGVNLNVYINKVRIELSKNYLLLSDESITEIAANVGFNDPNYFSRVFQQIIGIPPTEFRRRFRAEG